MISRDHHDVSGTDSPFRETSNIYDGSAFCAGTHRHTHNLDTQLYIDKLVYLFIWAFVVDMAVQNCIGDAFRGATWVALHNGGGVGW